MKGEENTDRITKELDVGGFGIEGFTCVSVRRLGRLLPNACWVSYIFLDFYHFKFVLYMMSKQLSGYN